MADLKVGLYSRSELLAFRTGLTATRQLVLLALLPAALAIRDAAAVARAALRSGAATEPAFARAAAAAYVFARSFGLVHTRCTITVAIALHTVLVHEDSSRDLSWQGRYRSELGR